MSGRPLEVSAQEPSILSSEHILDAWLPPDLSLRKKMRKRRVSSLRHMESQLLIKTQIQGGVSGDKVHGWWLFSHGTPLLTTILSWNPSAFRVTSFPFDIHFMSFYSTHRLGDFQTLAPSLFRYQDWLLSNQSAPLSLPPAESQLTTSRTGQTELSSDQISAQGTWMKIRRGKSGLRTMQRSPVPGSYVLHK